MFVGVGVCVIQCTGFGFNQFSFFPPLLFLLSLTVNLLHFTGSRSGLTLSFPRNTIILIHTKNMLVRSLTRLVLKGYIKKMCP